MYKKLLYYCRTQTVGVTDTNKITPHSTFHFPQQLTSALRITLHTYLTIFIQLYTEDQKNITIVLVRYDHLKKERARNDSYNPASSWNYNVPKGQDPSLEKTSQTFLHASLSPAVPVSVKGNTCVHNAPIKIRILHLPFRWQHTPSFQTLLHPTILRKIFMKNKQRRMSRE